MARRYRSYMATKKNGQGQLPIACTERERERESERERRSFETELVSWGQAVDGAWSQAGRARGGTTYLIRESAGSQITKRQLESAVASLDIDLESDQGILVGSSSRRHDCDCYMHCVSSFCARAVTCCESRRYQRGQRTVEIERQNIKGTIRTSVGVVEETPQKEEGIRRPYVVG